MRREARLERNSMLAEAVAVGTTAVVRIVRLDRIIFPSAHTADLIGARRLFLQGDEAAARARVSATRRLVRLPQEPAGNVHHRSLTVAPAYVAFPHGRARVLSPTTELRLPLVCGLATVRSLAIAAAAVAAVSILAYPLPRRPKWLDPYASEHARWTVYIGGGIALALFISLTRC
jgi:hypothetical protein